MEESDGLELEPVDVDVILGDEEGVVRDEVEDVLVEEVGDMVELELDEELVGVGDEVDDAELEELLWDCRFWTMAPFGTGSLASVIASTAEKAESPSMSKLSNLAECIVAAS